MAPKNVANQMLKMDGINSSIYQTRARWKVDTAVIDLNKKRLHGGTLRWFERGPSVPLAEDVVVSKSKRQKLAHRDALASKMNPTSQNFHINPFARLGLSHKILFCNH